MDKKDKKKVHADKNEMVREVQQSELIKNPVIYSQLHGDYTLMQQQVMWGLTAQLQDRIDTYLDQKRKGMEPTGLFVKEDFDEGYITFNIPLSDLAIRPDAYDELEQACQRLLDMKQVYEDPSTGNLVMNNIFYGIEIPKSDYKDKRRKNYIEVKMIAAQVKDVFSMTHGYTEHMRRIVDRCKRRYTPHLYVYLSKYKAVGHKQISYIELKDYFGLITWDKNRKNIVEQRYEKYAHFKLNVLDPIKKEINMLWERGEIDLTFEYTPIYQFGRKRGAPDQILFTIKAHRNLEVKKQASIPDDIEEAQIVEDNSSWQQLATLACEEHQRWWEVFGTCCKAVEVNEERLVIGVPSTFVQEQWNKELVWLLPMLQKCFISKKLFYRIGG